MEHKGFSVLVWALNPYTKLVPLVRGGEGHRLHADLWRLPGGCSLPGEFPKKTAIREMFEETGIIITNLQDIHTVIKECHLTKDTHEQFVYTATFHSTENILERGNEGEIVELFKVNNLPSAADMYAPHWNVIQKTALR